MWESWRRFGLAVSIAGAMGASGIGGLLMGRHDGAPAAVQTASAAAAPAASAVVAEAAAAAVIETVSAVPGPAAPPSHDVAEAVQASTPHGDPADGPVAVERHGSPTPAAPHEGPAHAPATAPAEPSPAAAMARGKPELHEATASPAAHAAVAVAVAAPLPVSAVLAPTAAPAKDITFGLDLNGDGIPDSLERFIRKTIAAPATRVAARSYYRIALPLATRAQQGDLLAHADKQAVFRAAECYLVSAAEDGLADPPNLNDRASLIGIAAADRIQAMAEALQGFDYRVAANRRQTCS